MKLLICGLPPNKLPLVPAMVPAADVRCVGCKESVRIWQQRVRPADAVIVLTHLISHKHMAIVRAVFGRNVIQSTNFNDAIATANALAAH